MASVGEKITPTTLKVATGVLFGVALVLAIGRTVTKALRFRRVFFDDIFFFFSIIFLIVGTILAWVELPYTTYLETLTLGTVTEAFSVSDFVDNLDNEVKLSDASDAMLNACNYSVKLSFLFFFKGLLRRLRELMIWWWCVLVYVILAGLAAILATAAVCPASGIAILEKCTTPTAHDRDNAILFTFIAADIVADLCVISIPVILLWRVKISIRQKIALASTLCLSTFVILTNILRASATQLDGNQVDYLWVIFWLECEACVSVIVLSFAAFRSLFVKEDSQNRASPHTFRNTWLRLKNGSGNQAPHVDLPTMPAPAMTGLRSLIRKASGSDDLLRSEGRYEPLGILVTHDINQEKTANRDSDSPMLFV